MIKLNISSKFHFLFPAERGDGAGERHRHEHYEGVSRCPEEALAHFSTIRGIVIGFFRTSVVKVYINPNFQGSGSSRKNVKLVQEHHC